VNLPEDLDGDELYTLDPDRKLKDEQVRELVRMLMLQQQGDTALSFVPTLPFPQGVISEEDAEKHIEALKSFSDGIGPTVLVQAVQKVVSEAL